MFNLQRSEISIYHRHNDGEPEREKKGEQEARGARSEASFPPPVLPHELNTNWKKRSSVCVARALIRACECSTSFFLRRGLESYICSSPPLPASHQQGGTVSPSRPSSPPPHPSSPALSGCTLQTYIIGHHCYARGSTAFILISACRPICKKNEIIPPRQTSHLSKLNPRPILRPPRASCCRPRQGKNVWRRHFLQPAELTADVYHHKRWSYAHIPRH